ncbi:MAG: hypothetical protein CME62_07220 [Halobacteriovoraceae bacterium]|nr:hypothetical protein [Halobacteriovoraceae bacterium]|tara:strand:+ start:18703 stop:19038 length:336 start_codon:yes stop_codon:yes gene_type:complete
MRLILLMIFLTTTSSYGIELIIGGKTYYIEKYTIKDNGETIEIPYQIALKEEDLNKSACSGSPQQKVVQESSARAPGGRKFNDLMQSVQGGFNSLKRSLDRKQGKSKRNYR